MRAQVLKNWTQSYDPALKVARGDRVRAIKKDDHGWQGWVWCTSDNGLSGWLPVQVFDTLRMGETNCVTKDFDTKELTVKTGETLTITDRLNGWSWCENEQSQKGWVPDNCLEYSQ